jgi:hypothetical protein
MALLAKGKKAKRKNALGVLFMLTTVALIGAALAAYFYAVFTQEKLDARNCPERGPLGVTVIFIDATDPFTPRQSVEITKGIQGVVNNLREGEEVNVYTLRPGGEKIRTPDFSACKPREHGSFLYDNVRAVAERFRIDFKSKLEVALLAAIEAKSAKESPIIEALADIGVGAFRSVPASTPKRLVIVSDLLQYSKEFTQYQTPSPAIEQFRKLPASITLMPRLEGVKTCFVYLDRERDRQFQGTRHVEFWMALIAQAGAERASCEPLVQAGSYLIRI